MKKISSRKKNFYISISGTKTFFYLRFRIDYLWNTYDVQYAIIDQFARGSMRSIFSNFLKFTTWTFIIAVLVKKAGEF